MGERIPYTFTRDSVAALIKPHGESRLVQAGIPVVGYPGVRGGGGFLIMPAVTQQFYDNYLSNQTVDAAIGSPWTISGTVTARDENTLLGSRSAEIAVDSYLKQTFTLPAVTHVVSAFVYAPPPAMLDKIDLFFNSAYCNPTGIVSLGDYRYFFWFVSTSVNTPKGYGIAHRDGSEGSIWVDCLSLTQTAAPVGFVPNSQTAATQASADDNLKFTLSEPLPQSGSLSFVVIPFFADTNKAVDDDPVILSFFPSGGDTSGDDYLLIQIDDNGSQGIYAVKKVGGGSAESTGTTGYAATGFAGFTPIEVVLTWDFAAGGTKRVNIFANGELVVESADWDEGFPVNLTDMWVGSQRDTGPANTNHAQSTIQDVQVHRR